MPSPLSGSQSFRPTPCRFDAYWPEDNKWVASVLVVASRHAVPTQPRLLVKDGEQQPQFSGTLLDSHGATVLIASCGAAISSAASCLRCAL